MKKILFTISFIAVLISIAFADGTTIMAAYVNTVFPDISAQSLTDKIVNLPADVTNTVAMLLMTYQKPGDGLMETWLAPFIKTFSGNSKTAYYAIAMVGDAGIINGIIYNGMRGGTADEMKNHVLVYFKDKEGYKKIFNITDDSLIYVYLLDRQGIIRLIKTGKAASTEDNKEIISTAQSLLQPPVKGKVKKKK